MKIFKFKLEVELCLFEEYVVSSDLKIAKNEIIKKYPNCVFKKIEQISIKENTMVIYNE